MLQITATVDQVGKIVNIAGITDSVPADSNLRKLILAAVMCIDMVLKE